MERLSEFGGFARTSENAVLLAVWIAGTCASIARKIHALASCTCNLVPCFFTFIVMFTGGIYARWPVQGHMAI